MERRAQSARAAWSELAGYKEAVVSIQMSMDLVTGSRRLGIVSQRWCSEITLAMSLVLPVPVGRVVGSFNPWGCAAMNEDTASMYAVMVLALMFLHRRV